MAQFVERKCPLSETPIGTFDSSDTCGRQTSSMQCTRATQSTCPTARTPPYNSFEVPMESLSLLRSFPQHTGREYQTAGCMDDLPDSVKIIFNVGGKENWCTLGTLRGGTCGFYAEDEDCFFKKLLKREWASSLEYVNGSVYCYIDRNGKCFSYIIDYIRRGDITKTDDKGVLDMIVFEADFYGLYRLKALAEIRLNEVQKREDRICNMGEFLSTFMDRVFLMEQQTKRKLGNSTYSDILLAGSADFLLGSCERMENAADNGSCDSITSSLFRRGCPALQLFDHSEGRAQHQDLGSRVSSTSPTTSRGSDMSFQGVRAELINDDPEPSVGATREVLCKFYAQDFKFATNEEF